MKIKKIMTLDDFDVQSGAYSFEALGSEISFYIKRHESSKTVVFLPGAINRLKGHVDFQRYSWCSDIEANCFVFSDPTINEKNSLSIGWFQGNNEGYAFDALVFIISKILEIVKISPCDLLIFGSSAGGFVGLQLASIFKDAVVFSINPQIYLEKYSKKYFYEMMSFSYEGMDLETVKKVYGDRISVPNKFHDRTAPIFILQNLADTQHLRKHLQPWLQTINSQDVIESRVAAADINGIFALRELSKVNVLYYTDATLKHTPPSKNDMFKYLYYSLSHSDFGNIFKDVL